MQLTNILVDFENVQPSAQDIALVRGDDVRLTIFRGPGQKKYSADVAEAWQPLGKNVSFVRCAKAGRNAIDMHIALHIGKLIGEQKSRGASAAARFIIVSKDTDYDPLLIHIRDALGQVASRVSSIKSALEGRVEPRTAKALKTAPPATTAKKSTPTKAAAKKSSGKSATKKVAAKAPAVAKTKVAAKVAVHSPISDAKQKVIDGLRRMGDKRPVKRKGLERHIAHLCRTLAPEAIQDLLAELDRDGVLRFSDKKVEYVSFKESK